MNRLFKIALLCIAVLIATPAMSVADVTPQISPQTHVQLETIQASPEEEYVLSNTPAEKSTLVERPGLKSSREYQCIRRAGLVTCFR